MAHMSEVETGQRWTARLAGRRIVVKVVGETKDRQTNRTKYRLFNETSGKPLQRARSAAFLRTLLPSGAQGGEGEQTQRDEARAAPRETSGSSHACADVQESASMRELMLSSKKAMQKAWEPLKRAISETFPPQTMTDQEAMCYIAEAIDLMELAVRELRKAFEAGPDMLR